MLSEETIKKCIEKATYEERFEDAAIMEEVMNLRKNLGNAVGTMQKGFDGFIGKLNDSIKQEEEKRQKQHAAFIKTECIAIGMWIMSAIIFLISALRTL